MSLDQNKIDKMLALIRESYPGWTGFSDPRFVKDEAEYKRRTVTKAQELLDETEFRRLLSAGDFATIISRFENLTRSNNLLFNRVPQKGDAAILYTTDLDKAAFCAAMLDLLYGQGIGEERLKRYIDFVVANDLLNKWAFPTYFLFIFHPDEEILVKPQVMLSLLQFVSSPLTLPTSASAETYAALKQIVVDLKEKLHEYGPQDMVDIQSLIWVCAGGLSAISPSYWKIAPGENARRWDDWRNGGYMTIGWEEMGDLTGLSKLEFDTKRDVLLAKHREDRDWGKGGVDQIWTFLHIKPGDRIVANRGTTEVVGIGTVVGDYSFVPGIEHGNRIPVEWEDVAVRRVNKGGWRSTLIKLDKREFDEICSAPLADGEIASVNPACPFSETTFELLAELHDNPKRSFYLGHKAEFVQFLETPFKQLFAELGRNLPSSVTDVLETQKGVVAKILKNDFGLGGAWDFYWGAFYPKGGKRVEDAQLFIWVNRDYLEFGFYIGEYGSEQRKRFLRNCQQHRDALVNVLHDSLADDIIIYGSHEDLTAQPLDSRLGKGHVLWDAWLKNPAQEGIHASVFLKKVVVLKYSEEELRRHISKVFERLFPLVLLATLDDPLAAIGEYVNLDPDPELNPEYTLAQCATDTGFDEAELHRWVRAIERKKQAVIYGPPGTGKTYVAKHLAQHLIGGGDGFEELVQFHPAYAYEDFIQGIRPHTKDGAIDYHMVSGRFLDFCTRAKSKSGLCVLTVDEINRANLSRVFGELMYLLEYRDSEIPLAGGGLFRIPGNVRIIGTMNTADRSIALVDHALRRRFAFLELRPNYEVLRRYHQSNGFDPAALIDALQSLNKAIADAHYEVGISFFLREDLHDQIEDIWKMEIEPYLVEYFFDQPGKVDQFRWDKIEQKIMS